MNCSLIPGQKRLAKYFIIVFSITVIQAQESMITVVLERDHGFLEVVSGNIDEYQLVSPLADRDFTTPGGRLEIPLVHGQVRRLVLGGRACFFQCGADGLEDLDRHAARWPVTGVGQHDCRNFLFRNHRETRDVPGAASTVANICRVLVPADIEAEPPGGFPVRVYPVNPLHFTQRICGQDFLAAVFQQAELPACKARQVVDG